MTHKKSKSDHADPHTPGRIRLQTPQPAFESTGESTGGGTEYAERWQTGIFFSHSMLCYSTYTKNSINTVYVVVNRAGLIFSVIIIIHILI